ncbi:unnamed protein product [Spirodela intermedia]|uniref:Uncharacterized protein n=1 Tax=Spirodela intermedia TaxID=51605 RepID=A0ABN7E9T2_SPIIN|nr:unnamed protein product [Spirodela intermedia]
MDSQSFYRESFNNLVAMLHQIALTRFSPMIQRFSIVNPSSKSSLIDRRTSRRREEDDPPGDESPPLESVPDVMKSLLLLCGLEDEAP